MIPALAEIVERWKDKLWRVDEEDNCCVISDDGDDVICIDLTSADTDLIASAPQHIERMAKALEYLYAKLIQFGKLTDVEVKVIDANINSRLKGTHWSDGAPDDIKDLIKDSILKGEI